MLKGPGAGQTPEVQAQMANDVNDRLSNAVEDLKHRYQHVGVGFTSNNATEVGPSGSAYKEADKAKAKAKYQEKAMHEARLAAAEEAEAERAFGEVASDDEEDEDADSELRHLREARLREMKSRNASKQELIGKGHGQFREIVQDEFLKEVTGSDRVVVHFYHRDFERCAIMDMHLLKLAKRHIETKFIKIDAEKAPFFVSKLSVRTMPTLCQFIDGVMRGKLVGFEGLADHMPEGKEDEWTTIHLANILATNTMIDAENVVDEDADKTAALAKMAEMRTRAMANMTVFDLDNSDDDFDC